MKKYWKDFLKNQSKIRIGVIIMVIVSFLLGLSVTQRVFNLWPLHRLYDKISYSLSDIDPLFPSFQSTQNGAFLEVWDKVRYEYLDEVTEESIIRGAYNGILDSLNDPYTYVEDEHSISSDQEENEGIIGVFLGYKKNVVYIASLMNGGPAFISGLLKGDVLLKVNGEDVLGESIKDVKSLLSGSEGDVVEVLIYRERTEELLLKKIQRTKSNEDIVTVKALSDNIIHFSISSFSDDLYEKFEEAFDSYSKPISAMIIDLRGNPGGNVAEAIKVISQMVPPNKKIMTQKFRSGEVKEYISEKSKYPYLIDIPKVILVDSMTASCSEIMTTAIRDIQNVQVIGEKTFGKGVITSEMKISDDEILHIRVAKWFGPKGEYINKKGIVPDIELDENVELKAKEILLEDIE